jgi:hypothetical protein
MAVRNFDILPFNWGDPTQFKRQLLYLYPDVGNWVIFRKDSAPSDIVGKVKLFGKIVGTSERDLGRQVGIVPSGSGMTVWCQFYRQKDHTWRVKFAYYYYTANFNEVFDSEKAALANL